MNTFTYIIALVIFTIAVMSGVAAIAGYWLSAAVLAALAIYIVWDSFLARSTTRPNRFGLVSGQSASQVALIVCAVVSAIVGTYLFFYPQHPPFSGSYAFVWSSLYSGFGVFGGPLACWALALGLGAKWTILRKAQDRVDVQKDEGGK